MKGGLVDIAPLWFGAIRTVIPGLLLIMLLPLLGKALKPPPLSFVLPFGLLQTTGYIGFTMLALKDGSAGQTAVLVFTMPIWLTLMAHLFLNEHLKLQHWLALMVAGIGLLLMIAPWQANLTIAASIFGLLSGLTWAGGSLWQKKYGRIHKIEMVNVTAWQIFIGGIVLLVCALLFEDFYINWTPHLAWVLFYNIIPVGAGGWLIWFYVLEKLPTKTASFGSLLTPAIGLIAAWLQLGETPNPSEFIGILLILSALVIILWPSRTTA